MGNARHRVRSDVFCAQTSCQQDVCSLCGEGISKITCSKSSTQCPSGMLGSRYHLVKQRQGHRCRRLDSDIKQTQEMVEKKATRKGKEQQGAAVPSGQWGCLPGRVSLAPLCVTPTLISFIFLFVKRSPAPLAQTCLVTQA